jgi:hypothetical protein
MRREPLARVVIALDAGPDRDALAALFAGRGLKVEIVHHRDDVRRIAGHRTDTAVILPVAPQSEGGLLATAKVVNAMPTARVVLVTPLPDERVAAFAEFMDTAIVFTSDGLQAIADTVVKTFGNVNCLTV